MQQIIQTTGACYKCTCAVLVKLVNPLGLFYNKETLISVKTTNYIKEDECFFKELYSTGKGSLLTYSQIYSNKVTKQQHLYCLHQRK